MPQSSEIQIIGPNFPESRRFYLTKLRKFHYKSYSSNLLKVKVKILLNLFGGMRVEQILPANQLLDGCLRAPEQW